MLRLRKSAERGHVNLGWLDSWHSFSFGEYYDPEYMGYSVLRVINEDVIVPAKGFGMHPHRNMEIVTYMLRGALRHEDSLGNGSVIRAGDVQRMTAGSGIVHSEFNASDSEPVHLLQIWVLPERNGLEPGYEEKHFSDAEKQNRWCLIASPDGRDGSLTVHQNASIYAALLADGDELEYCVQTGRSLYLQMVRGLVNVAGESMQAGDAAKIEEPQGTRIKCIKAAELLLFDLPA